MAEEIVVFGPNARLNITVNGQNGDYPDLLSYDSADGDIKQIATEAVRTGYVPGIQAANVNFNDFVVDRFPATNELPPRLMLRPKTPFGVKKEEVVEVKPHEKGTDKKKWKVKGHRKVRKPKKES